MDWKIKSREDYEKAQVIQGGTYPFKIISFEEQVDSSKDKVAVIVLSVKLPSGSEFKVYDRFYNSSSSFPKREALCRSIGHPELLNAPLNLYIGKSGKAKFKTKTFIGKEGNQMTALAVEEYLDPPVFRGGFANISPALQNAATEFPGATATIEEKMQHVNDNLTDEEIGY